MTRAGQVSGQAFNEALTAEANRSNVAANRLRQQLESSFLDAGRRSGRGFGGAFGSELAQSLPGVSGFASSMAGYESAAGKVGAVAGRALGLAFTTAAAGLIGAAGYTLFKGFERYEAIDAAKNRLQNLNATLAATGRATIDVGRVMETVNQVVEGTPFALDKAFGIATTALSSSTGDLNRFMTAVANTAGFLQRPIDDIGKAFLDVAANGKLGMEQLSNELKGLPLDWIAQTMGVTTAELSKMMRENKVGLEDLLVTVEKNLDGFAKGSVNTVSGAMDQVQTAVARLGANFLGAIFGAPTDDANGLVEALNALQARFDDINAWVTAHRDDIKQAFDTAVEVVGNLLKVLGNVGDWFVENKSVAAALGTVIGTAFAASKLSGFISGLQTINTLLGGSAASGAAGAAGSGIMGKVAALSAANVAIPTLAGNQIANQIEGEDRPWWWAIQRGFTAPGRIWDKAFGSDEAPSPGGSTAGLQTLPGFNFGPQAQLPAIPGRGLHWEDGKGWVPDAPGGSPGPAGSPIQPPPGLSEDEEGGSRKGPTLPVVPYTGDPMSLLQGYPATSSLYGAAESVLKSRHAREQAESDLNALMASNEATAEQIQEARNKLHQADADIFQAELRLNEAKQSATEKYAKTLNSAVGELGQIGAQLDSDFGISKGLAGIAENLTKFLANLAAAPLLGQLGAISAASPSQGGYGLMGMLGAQGAFGPQFTGIDYSQYGAAMGPAAFMPPIGGGQPYGLPAGTNTGGYGSSGAVFPPWVHQLEQIFGVKASTYPGHQEGTRNEPGYAPNPMGLNRGIDWSGPVDAMQRFADYLATVPQSLEQVIWQNPNTGRATEIAGGRPQPGYFSGDLGGHQDHVHTRQSASIPIPGGRPGMPQWSADWNAIAQKESGGNWSINTGNGFFGGLQFTPSSWQAAGGTQYAPSAHQATPFQQAMTAEQLLAMQGPGAWPNTFVPGSSGPGGGVAYPGIGMPQGLPYGQSPQLPGLTAPGGMGVGAGAGAGLGPQPGVGGAAGTRIGGVDPLQGVGKGGVGMTGGGTLDLAMQAGGMALDALAPGAGQAAQTGMKLINRTIEYGAQAVGIGVQGAMDTFIPFGGSQLAQNNWLTRIVGGLAGAAPALPNMAGKASQPTAEQVAGVDPNTQAHGQGQGQPPGGGNTYNANITNNQPRDESGTGRDALYVWQNQGPGM